MSQPSFNLREATIYSICPWVLPALFRPYAPDPKGGATIFQMPIHTIEDLRAEAPPKFLKVYDSFQAEMQVHMALGVAKQHEAPKFVFLDFIVSDLLQHWTRQGIGIPNECGPGVWVSQGPNHLAEEITLNNVRQINYAEFLYGQAKEYEMEKKYTHISRPHRIAAAVLGREEFWAKTAAEKVGSSTKCPLCLSTVLAGAYICAACGRQIKEFPAELAKMNAPEVESMERPRQRR